jgi:hypothetical protein
MRRAKVTYLNCWLYDKDSDECPVWELPISSIYNFNHFTERSLSKKNK